MEHTTSHFGHRRRSYEAIAQAKYSSDNKGKNILDILKEYMIHLFTSLEPNNKLQSIIHIFEFCFEILLAWVVITKITEEKRDSVFRKSEARNKSAVK